MSAGMLLSQVEPSEGCEERFHEWYENHHIPARMALDGFQVATRYRALTGKPAYLAVYELTDLAALESPEYQRLELSSSEQTRHMRACIRGLTRFSCERSYDSGPAREHSHLSVVAFAVPERDVAEFDDWYETEHIPALLRAEDWLRIRRYRVVAGEGAPWTHIAVHELGSIEVLDSPERAAARQGPKREALTDRPWFHQSGRWLYETLSRHG